MKLIRLVAGFAAVAAAGPVAAADFTFDVPVRLENLPSVARLRVGCAVYTGGTGRLMASGDSGFFPVTDGRFDGTVTVEIDNRGLTLSSEARAYSCGLTVWGTARTGGEYSAQPDNFTDIYPRATGHTLVRTTSRIRGSIP